MESRVNVSLRREQDGAAAGEILCRIEALDPTLSGQRAKLTVRAQVDVKDGRPVNGERILHTEKLVLSTVPVEFGIPREWMRAYSYVGREIDIKVRTQLVVDDAILFDTKITDEHELELGMKPTISTPAGAIIEPKDTFDFFKNLQAIPPQARVLTLALAAVGAVIVLINLVVGTHDQFVAEAGTWFYSHVNSDGESQSPFVGALATSGALGALVWFLMRRQLRRYMKFSLRSVGKLRRGQTYGVHDLVQGASRVPLQDVTLRVVACNMELGQYRRGSGTDERTVSFREPVRGVVVYERSVDHVPARRPIAPLFSGTVDFEPMFAALYPPLSITSSHGLAVHWEVQLLHPDFVDQELVGPEDAFEYEDFLAGSRA